MNLLSTFLRNFKEKLLAEKQNRQGGKQPESRSFDESKINRVAIREPPASSNRDPYFIQIGFDFGTSYSKCVCRDVMMNKAWVHRFSGSENEGNPFLIPSALSISDGKISHVNDSAIHYPENGLYHLKNALVKVALEKRDDPVLKPYQSVLKVSDPALLSKQIESCAVYLLGGALGDVRKAIKKRFPGFGQVAKDYIAINMAVPVKDAEEPSVNELYTKILREAWVMADELTGFPAISLNELWVLREENRIKRDQLTEQSCYIYPEVSANVQGFVRSRVSSPGMYLFSDAGGGSVDQSIFIFSRQNGEDYLTYLSAQVLPCGSSNIERRAAEEAGSVDWKSLEVWRERKERGENRPELSDAKEWISKRLNRGTESTLALAKKKLFVKKELNAVKVIFGGGGHCDFPYKHGVMYPFSGQLFSKSIKPDVIGMPVPGDLELESNTSRWMQRLTVAYGLSFERGELARFTFPIDVSDPKPEEIWRPPRPAGHAPTKDEC